LAGAVGCSWVVRGGGVRADEPKTEPLTGRLFTFTNSRPQLPRPGLDLVLGVLDMETGTWSRLLQDGVAERASHDGRYVVYRRERDGDRTKNAYFVYDVEAGGDVHELIDALGVARAWSTDDSSLLFQTRKPEDNPGIGPFETWRVSSDGKTQERLPLSPNDLIKDWSPDGRRLLVTRRPERLPGPEERTATALPVDLISLDGTGRTPLLEGYKVEGRGLVEWDFTHRFTPDGQRVVYMGFESAVPRAQRSSLWSIDLGTGKKQCLVRSNPDELIGTFCVSPDEKHLAVTMISGPPGERAFELAIFDRDGTNRRSIPLAVPQYQLIDWTKVPK
jgi:Tol biopolymer transport system component